MRPPNTKMQKTKSLLQTSNYSQSGVALREPHFSFFKKQIPQFGSTEVIFENFLFTQGERREILFEISKNYQIHLHGVSSNIGSFDHLEPSFFVKLKELATKTSAPLISDHLCFTRIQNKSTFELLPIPKTKKMLEHVGSRINSIRDILGHDFCLENISYYFSYDVDEMSEVQFFAELYDKYQVKMLLDVNNLYVNAYNFRYSAQEFIKQLPDSIVAAYHLGGHENFESFLFDTHGKSIKNDVRDLYWIARSKFGDKPCFLERDELIPDNYLELENELRGILGEPG